MQPPAANPIADCVPFPPGLPFLLGHPGVPSLIYSTRLYSLNTRHTSCNRMALQSRCLATAPATRRLHTCSPQVVRASASRAVIVRSAANEAAELEKFSKGVADALKQAPLIPSKEPIAGDHPSRRPMMTPLLLCHCAWDGLGAYPHVSGSCARFLIFEQGLVILMLGGGPVRSEYERDGKRGQQHIKH